MNQEPRVRITGLGAVCAAGNSVDSVFDGLVNGAVHLRQSDSLTDVPAVVGEVRGEFPVDCNRALELARIATKQALAQADWAPGPQTGLIVATTKAAIGLAQRVLEERADPSVLAGFPLFELGAQLAREFGFGGPVNTVSVACASGTAALAQAGRWLRSRRCDRVLVVGVDALSEFVVHGFTTLRALCRDQARPFDRDRTGLSPGEGAAAIALESGDGPALAHLVGFGGSNDANHITGPSRDGAGLVRSITAALADANVEHHAVVAVSAHGTATRYNDGMEAVGFTRVFGKFGVPIHSLKGAIGHTMGAAGVIEAVVAVKALERSVWPATGGHDTLDPELTIDVVAGVGRVIENGPVVSSSSGFSGINAAIVLSKEAPARRATARRPVFLKSVVQTVATTAELRLAAETLVKRPQRLDDICLGGLVATAELLKKTGWSDLADIPHVLTLGTALGCLESDYAYYGQVLDRGVARTNPRIFAYTLPNVVLGEVAIKFGLTGDQLAVSAGRVSGLAALAEAALRIESGEVERAIVMVIDAVGPGTQRLFEAAGRRPQPTVTAFALSTEGSGAVAAIESADLSFHGDNPEGPPDPDPLGAAGIASLIAAFEANESITLDVTCSSGHRARITLAC